MLVDLRENGRQERHNLLDKQKYQQDAADNQKIYNRGFEQRLFECQPFVIKSRTCKQNCNRKGEKQNLPQTCRIVKPSQVNIRRDARRGRKYKDRPYRHQDNNDKSYRIRQNTLTVVYNHKKTENYKINRYRVIFGFLRLFTAGIYY